MKKALFLMALLLFSTLSVFSVSALNQTNFTANSTYTVPAGVSYIFVETWGGGGSGASEAANSARGGGGGGGGAYAASYISVTPGQVWTVTVGSGGASPAAGAFDGTNGTDSIFNRSSVNVTAAAGRAGLRNAGGGGPGGLVINSTGQIIFSGGTGDIGALGNTGVGYGGGGGGGAGSLSSGGTAVNNVTNQTGGTGGQLYGGNGGTGSAVDANGQAGSTIGGGGSSAYCDGSCTAKIGGAGARGEVRVTEITDIYSGVFVTVKDANNASVVNVPVNVTYYDSSLNAYNFSSPNGNVVFNILSGTYIVVVSASGYSPTYGRVTFTGGNVTNSTYFVDSAASPVTFIVANTLGQTLSNISVSFSRSFNGTVLVYTQLSSDTSGILTPYLNPSLFYLITAIDPTGTYSNYTGTVFNPSSANAPYIIRMSYASGASYNNSPYNNTYTNPNATYNNNTKKINVTWEVINVPGDLLSWGLNTTYNGSVYSMNLSGSPNGGVAYVNISNVDLSFQDSINVTFFFQRSNFTFVTFTLPFTFIDNASSSSSLTGGLFDPPTAPSQGPGRALLGMFILLICVAATYRWTGQPEPTLLVAIIVTVMFSSTAVNLFPRLFGLIAVVIAIMALMVGAVRR